MQGKYFCLLNLIRASLYGLLLPNSVLAVSSVCVLGDFDQQFEMVLRHIRLPQIRLRETLRVISDIQQTMQMRWPGSEVIQFGATTSGLAFKGSDMDSMLSIPNITQTDTDSLTILLQAKSELMLDSKFSKFQLDPRIYCPLLSFIHVPTKMPVDLIVIKHVSLRSSVLLAHLINIDKRILSLAIIIKYWSHVHGIAGEKSVLSYYSMTLLVLFYLQQKNMLPPIATLQNNAEPHMIDNWNTAFSLLKYETTNNESLYELLGGFFQYYSEFNFNDVISPYCGYVIKRNQIANLQNLPKELSLYENNLKIGVTEAFIFGSLNIQDIFEFNMNVGKRQNSSILDNLIYHTKLGAKLYKELSSDKYLLTILKSHNKEIDIINMLRPQDESISESCLA